MAPIDRVVRDLFGGWTEPAPPLSRVRVATRGAACALALIVAAVALVRTARPIVAAPKPAVLTDGPGDVKYGLTEPERRAIFAEIAAAEPHGRTQGIAGFPDQPWSQEDHRCAFERDTTRGLAARLGLALTQIYLVLDEGIRGQWPGPDGKPLRPTTVPLAPRRR
jgi:hypothetical protein